MIFKYIVYQHNKKNKHYLEKSNIKKIMITIRIIPENDRFDGGFRRKQERKQERFPNLLIIAKARC